MVDGISSSQVPKPAPGAASPATADGVARVAGSPNLRIDSSGGLVTIMGDVGDTSVPMLALPRNMDADVLMTLLYAIQQKQGQDQIKTSEQRIDDKRVERQKKHEHIMKMIKRAHKAEHKDKTGATVGKVFGWIGVGLAWVMVGIVAVASGGAAAVPMAIAATALTAFMIAQETGGTEKAIEAMNVDGKTAMGIQIGLAVTMLVIMIAATIASGGAAGGGVASGVSDVAAASAEAGAAGAELGAAGVETGAAGAEVAAAGAEAGAAGAEAGAAGAEAGAAGAEAGAAGTEAGAAGTEAGAAGTEVASAGAETGAEGATSTTETVTQTASRSAQLVRMANRLRSAAMIAQGVSQAGGGSAEIATAKYSYDGASARADAQDDRAEMAKYQEITYEELRRIRKLIEQMQNAAAQVVGTIDQTQTTAMNIRRTV